MTNDSDAIPPRENGLRAFLTLGQFLREDKWFPQQIADTYVYRMGFAGRNAQVTCLAAILVDAEQLLFYVIAPDKAPEDKRAAVAEYITRANYGLRIGNLEMDFADGEVRYKSSLDFREETLTPRMIKNTIYPAVQAMDLYLPGLKSVIDEDQPPAEAIVEVQESVRAEPGDS
jgi:hypothetical protein